MVKHEYKEVYGCFFHPEAMNPEIILNFTLET
jgi:GMP synthase-like glutamine amidotransferase